ncbi:hypothetical protein QQ045_031519 [Rhodiola kirilowii]
MGDLAMNTSALASPISQQSQGASTTAASVPETKPKKKLCCACPDTKKLRDECIVEHGEAACSKWINAHLKCLRAEGFNVSAEQWNAIPIWGQGSRERRERATAVQVPIPSDPVRVLPSKTAIAPVKLTAVNPDPAYLVRLELCGISSKLNLDFELIKEEETGKKKLKINAFDAFNLISSESVAKAQQF